MARNQTAVIQSVRILLNNLKLLLAADDIRGRLRDQIPWFSFRIQIMYWFLEVHYSEEGSSSDHHVAVAAGASNDDEMNRVVGMIRDFAVESGDVLVDEFEEKIAKQDTTSRSSTARNDNPAAAAAIGGVLRIVSLIFNCIHVDARELQNMARKESAKHSLRFSRRRVHPDYLLADIMGFARYTEIIRDRFIWESLELDVVAITGEGGTGKTSLAKYFQRHSRPFMNCSAWITVSKAYVLRDLLLGILKDITVITERIHEMDEREMKNEIRMQLRGTDRYLIVVDDVWDTHAWDELKDAFPENKYGRWILITTRFPSVASYAIGPAGEKSIPLPEELFSVDDDPGFPALTKSAARRLKKIWTKTKQYSCFELKPLSKDASWKLFCRLYFKKECRPCDGELLKTYGRRIVRRCCGRPLVTSVLARMLRAIDGCANDGSSWSSVASQIKQEPSGDLDRQMDILTLCFRKLPQHLQSCFLYLAVFPEDAEISVKQLIHLWIAEGLIDVPAPLKKKNTTANPNRTLEDIAEDCLQVLIDLRLILVSKFSIGGGAKSCRIHDILRDLCINLSKEEGFLEVHTAGGDHLISINGTDQTEPKILSILGNCREYLSKSRNSSSPGSSCSHVRSFSSFSQDTRSFSKEDWESLFKHFKLLRVLNLGEQEAQNKLDDSIEELIHLRYLKVKPAKHIKVPVSAIFNLCHLQTIDLRGASFSKLPVEIWKLQRLRHLYLGGQLKLPKATSEDHLPNLLTLSYISNDPRRAIRIAEKAPNLRKLGLNRYHCASKEEQEATFNLPHLRSLKFAEECTFKETITLPATITKITVKGALVHSDAIKIFGKLQNLQILKLQTNFVNEKLEVLGEDSFPKLRLLQLANSNIVTWILDEGAMRRLHCLVLSSCSQLLDLPDELWNVSTLKKLDLLWCSGEFLFGPGLSNAISEKEGLRVVYHPWHGGIQQDEMETYDSQLIDDGDDEDEEDEYGDDDEDHND